MDIKDRVSGYGKLVKRQEDEKRIIFHLYL